jgi:hypothetical protein
MDIRELQKKVMEIQDALHWEQYLNPKDLVSAFYMEAAVEHFRPMSGDLGVASN